MTTSAPIVVAPTARLARNLAREHAARMATEGRTAWRSPEIYSFSAWLGRMRDAWLLDADDERVPITAQQSLLLWQSLVDRTVFVGEPKVAELALRAWRLVHEYDLDPPERWPALLLSDDSRQFKGWAAGYRALCARRRLLDEWTFAADLPRLVAEKRIAAPASIELVAFDLAMTPLQQRIFDAFAAAGTAVARRQSPGHGATLPSIQVFEDADEELVGAARWARQLLEHEAAASIAIVVPDLGGRVDRVERAFRRVFDPPSFVLQPSSDVAWHVSLGKPLADWPLVADAFAILRLEPHRLTQPDAGRLLRSPFLPLWDAESQTRAQALAHLARRAPYDLTTNELRFALTDAGATGLAERFTAWQAARRDARERGWPSEWAARFQTELSAFGFAGGRSLDSREYQVLRRWHDLLESFGALDVVCAGPVARDEALSILRDRARDTVFREQNPGVPVEVLGVEEALGSRFDALWITTLDSDTWPGPTRRDPLVPASIQARVPRATTDGCLERAQRELAALVGAAPLVHGSFARGSAETPLERTMLLRDCALDTAPPAVRPVPAAMETQTDAQAPALEGAQARGGTSVLRNQSACPFRAFAESRLAAADLTPPRPGLDAAQRGEIVHKALEHFWRERRGRTDLLALTDEALGGAIASAVAAALDDFTREFSLALTRAGRALEARRTARALERWLALEREREDFTVAGHEIRTDIRIGGLALKGKVDRVDILSDGRPMLIDYKTGRTGRSDWYPDARLVDPQLPAYALAMDPQPAAIAFARIRPEKFEFDGLSDGASGTRGVVAIADAKHRFRDIGSWVELLDGWQTHLEALANDFTKGRAVVDPRRPAECQHCHLHALCRIEDRVPFDGNDGDAVDE